MPLSMIQLIKPDDQSMILHAQLTDPNNTTLGPEMKQQAYEAFDAGRKQCRWLNVVSGQFAGLETLPTTSKSRTRTTHHQIVEARISD